MTMLNSLVAPVTTIILTLDAVTRLSGLPWREIDLDAPLVPEVSGECICVDNGPHIVLAIMAAEDSVFPRM